jgi:glutathione synthase/RimK-type ligase-like ATP-grasp enzyme
VNRLVVSAPAWYFLHMRFAIIARRPTPTNEELVAAEIPGPRWELMTPEQALDVLVSGDVALGRLDVLPTLDGMDDGLWALGALAARGVVVLNDPPALLGAHDKLLTARLLRHAGIPHPRTWHVRDGRPAPVPKLPVVVKPRFGSWGSDVYRCEDYDSLHTSLATVRDTAWFGRHGALVQELVPPRGATTIALAAAAATGASLVGVDLLPDGASWTVLELNGAVELTREYAPWGDVFAEIALVLGTAALDRLAGRSHLAADIA